MGRQGYILAVERSHKEIEQLSGDNPRLKSGNRDGDPPRGIFRAVLATASSTKKVSEDQNLGGGGTGSVLLRKLP